MGPPGKYSCRYRANPWTIFFILSVILQGQDLPFAQVIVVGPLQAVLCHAPNTWTDLHVRAVTSAFAAADLSVGGAGRAQLSIRQVGQTQLILSKQY